jgi:hypothetical protein
VNSTNPFIKPFRLLSIATVLLSAISCGGKPPAAPAPPPPSFVGNWFGLVDISYVHPLSGETQHDVCNLLWAVTAQNDTTFSGQFQLPGGSARFPRSEECGGSGTFSGAVSSAGVVSALTFDPVLGGASVNRDCAAIRRPTFGAITSGASIRAEATDAIECLVNNRPAVIQRSLILLVNKQ